MKRSWSVMHDTFTAPGDTDDPKPRLRRAKPLAALELRLALAMLDE